MSVKLVMVYSVGDGCTWHATETLPFEYESAEAALVDFERMAMIARADGTYQNARDFMFVGHQFSPEDFYSRELDRWYFPEFLTLDEWFEQKRLSR